MCVCVCVCVSSNCAYDRKVLIKYVPMLELASRKSIFSGNNDMQYVYTICLIF